MRIQLPGGAIQTLENVRADQILKVHEPTSAKPTPVTLAQVFRMESLDAILLYLLKPFIPELNPYAYLISD
jgi:hypothetical protein